MNTSAATKREHVRELRATTAMTYREIADQLGISEHYAKKCGMTQAAYERYQAKSRLDKRNAYGTCERCGGETRYNGHRGRVSWWCMTCGSSVSADITRGRRGTGPLQQRILAFLDEPRRFMEISRTLGISKNRLAPTLHGLREYGLIERVSRGVYRRAT